MLVDRTKIFVKAGSGGDGCLSFRREKYVPRGGPNGGDGGRGGDVVLIASSELRSLFHFRRKRHFKGERGQHGQGSNRTGRSREARMVEVPVGTEVVDRDTGERLGELLAPQETLVVAVGGAGGRGNARFVSSTRQAPKIAEEGVPGEERWLVLTLRLRSDAGLIGFPSAGKSTLISRVSSAKSKVAEYHFTTLEPMLGVVTLPGGRTMVLADVPGLIEGAHEGSGLGDRFLRHVEHTRVFVHLVDVSPLSGRDPVTDFHAINEELRQYDRTFMDKPQVVAVNKIDMPGALERAEVLEKELPGHKIFKISALTGQGVDAILEHVWLLLKKESEKGE